MKATGILIVALAAVTYAQSPNKITYLALGDSVPFGMNVTLLPPYAPLTPQPSPSQFIGYPKPLATIQGWDANQVVDASCPGESSGSFLDAAQPDNGCNSVHVVPPPPGSGLPPIFIQAFKTQYGLHANYGGDQMTFALGQLNTDKKINLVTLSIGSNDVLMAIGACGGDPACVNAALPSVLGAYAANLGTILTKIRQNYRGTIVLLTYYSPDPSLDAIAQAVNGVMTQVGSQFPHVAIADGYTAFHAVSALFGGDACKAGLLIKLPPSPYNMSPCDIHPSPLGRVVLAAAIESALLR